MRSKTATTLCAATAAAALSLTISPIASAAVLANWTFETSQPTTAGPVVAESGVGNASSTTGGTFSSPAGNGSAHSYSSNTWDVGDYWQFATTPDGSTEYHITFDQTSSNTGPRDFKVQYSTDGSTFTDLGTYAVLANAAPNPTWNGTTSSPIYTNSFGVTGVPTSITSLTFRLVDTSTTSANGGTVAVTGTDRVDNVIINSGPVPEPASLGLLAAAGLFGMRMRRRR